jgi:hypothetical protein
MLAVSYSDISNGTVVLLTIVGCAADLDLRAILPAGRWQLSTIVMMIGRSLWRRLPWADFFEGFGDHRSRDGQAAVVNLYIQPWPDQQRAALEALLIDPMGGSAEPLSRVSDVCRRTSRA